MHRRWAASARRRERPRAERPSGFSFALALFLSGNTSSHGHFSCVNYPARHDRAGSTARQRYLCPQGKRPCPPLPTDIAPQRSSASRSPADKRGHPATKKARLPSAIASHRKPCSPQLTSFPVQPDTHAPSSQLGVFYPHDAHRIIGPLRHCAPRPKTRVLHHRVEFIGRPRSRHHRRDRRQHFAHRLWHRQLYRSYFRLRHLVAYGSRFRRATQAAK